MGLEPKPELIAAVVSVCGRTGNLSLGKAIHARAIIRSIPGQCVLLPTSLIDMYSKCGDLVSGLRVFDLMSERNVVSWTAMINGCVAAGSFDLAIDLFRRMGAEGIQPNRATMVAILPACSESRALKLGKEIHGLVFKRGLELESRVISGLINMYAKCKGATRLVSLIFERAKERDTITWSSMLAATSRNGDGIRTFKLFRRMKRDGSEPNSVTMLAVVDACVALASLDHGRAVLGYIVNSGFVSDVVVGNSLINMFAKCGCIESSSRVFFELMPTKDSVSYSSMIQSYGCHGCGRDALRLFEEMQELRFECDHITLLAILSACNHSGLVDEGVKIFESFNEDCAVGSSSVEHYACYVDLLGRGGRIEEAREVVRRMPVKPSVRILSSLVSACRVHGKFEMAVELARELIDMEPANSANYTLMSMIYADSENWDGVEEIRRVMRERGLRKNLGCSRI